MAGGQQILLVASEFPPNVGGIGNHAYNLAKFLALNNYNVTVLTEFTELSNQEISSFAKEQNFLLKWAERSTALPVTYINRLKLAISLASSSQIIICSGKFPLWLGMMIRMFNRHKQMIAVVHGSELDIKSSFSKNLTTKALSKFNKIVSVSNYTQSFLPALPTSINKYVIHNGINVAEFRLVGSEALNGSPALITVGSVTERKGQENVIRAIGKSKNYFPGVHYHVIGKPVIKAKLQAIAEQQNEADSVTFHGAVDRKELLQKLSSADVKMMLSNHTNDGDFEGFGIAVLEANALGKPAIGSMNSGIADAIDPGKTGELVDPKNPVAIADALNKIMNNYSEYSNNARQWAEQHDWNIIIKQYIKVISE